MKFLNCNTVDINVDLIKIRNGILNSDYLRGYSGDRYVVFSFEPSDFPNSSDKLYFKLYFITKGARWSVDYNSINLFTYEEIQQQLKVNDIIFDKRNHIFKMNFPFGEIEYIGQVEKNVFRKYKLSQL